MKKLFSYFTIILTLMIALELYSKNTTAKNIIVNFKDFYNNTSKAYYDIISKEITQELILNFNKINSIKIGNRNSLIDNTFFLQLPEEGKYSLEQISQIVKASPESNLILIGTINFEKKVNDKKNENKKYIIRVDYLDSQSEKIVYTQILKIRDSDIHRLADKITLKAIEIINKYLLLQGKIANNKKLKKSIEFGSHLNYWAYKTWREMLDDLNKEDYQKAIIKAEKVLDLEPYYLKAYEVLGLIHEQQGHIKIATYYYRQLFLTGLSQLDLSQKQIIYFNATQEFDITKAFEVSVEFLNLTAQKISKKGTNVSKAHSEYFKGINYITKTFFSKAKEALENSLNIYLKEKINLNIAKVYKALGYLHSYQNDLKKSRLYYNKAKKIYIQQKDLYEMAKINYMLALVFRQEKKMKQTLELFKKSLIYWIKSGNKLECISLYKDIGLVYEQLGRFKKARFYYNKGMTLSIQLKNKNYEALFKFHLDRLRFDYKGKNIIEAQDSLILIEDWNYKIKLFKALNNIGIIYQAMGKYDRAYRYFSRSIRMNKYYENNESLSASYNNMGLYFLDKNDFDNSLTYLVKALQINKQRKDQLDLAKSYHNIGALYFKMKNYNKSLALFNKAFKLRKKYGHQLALANTTYNLALIQEKLGNFNQAKKEINKTIKIEKIYGSPNYKNSIILKRKVSSK